MTKPSTPSNDDRNAGATGAAGDAPTTVRRRAMAAMRAARAAWRGRPAAPVAPREKMAAERWSAVVAGPRQVWPWMARLSGLPALGLVVVAAYGLAVDGTAAVAVGLIVAGGAFTVGALVGFLFGVPRALTGSGAEPGVRSNTNLEQISDWLTKILVGVGLVELGQLADSSSRLVRFLAPALGDAPSSEAFAAGLLAFFWSTGFMIGYVITRAVVGPLFAQTEWGHPGRRAGRPAAAGGACPSRRRRLSSSGP